jgi:AbrB family transcriptional regulator, transcriptional pleiotropic regulator of transition state genes
VASSGIRRKVDDLGRVVIPASIRRSLGIREGDAVEVTVDGERVILAKPRDACVFCGREDEGLETFRGRLLCRECLGGLGVLDERARAAEEVRQAAFPPGAAPAPETATPGTTPPLAPTPPTPAPAPIPTPPRPAAATSTASATTASATTEGGTAPRPVRAVREPQDRPAGPVDGDAWARARARGDDQPPPRRRPPQDPASTTAW